MSDLSFHMGGTLRGEELDTAMARQWSPPRTHYCADIVVPCYNEAEALPHTAPVLVEYFESLVADQANGLASFRLIFVNDGSKDETWLIIEDLAARHASVEGIMLSRNFGHQGAMLAGLTMADADVVITIDADLQDDVNAIAGMLEAYESGADLALGVRNDRTTDSFGKQGTANAYYFLLSIMGIRIVKNHADFRLISRAALDALKQYQEVNLFLRGLIPSLGFPVALVPYKRQERTAGETKYTLRKMVRLALDGITSFSIMPLRFIALTGALVFIGTLLLIGYFLYIYVTKSATLIPGWASTILPMLFLGGMQLLSIGILGEYVGKVYLETKRRPRFIVEKTTSAKIAARLCVQQFEQV